MRLPFTPGPRLYLRFSRAVEAQGLEVQAVADTMDVSRSHLYRVLIGERAGSAALWARITPYLRRAS